MALSEIVIRSAADLPARPAPPAASRLRQGEGIAALFRGRTLRFRCPGCLTRFAMDPDHFLEEGPAACCDGDAAHEESSAAAAPDAPSSEWVL